MINNILSEENQQTYSTTTPRHCGNKLRPTTPAPSRASTDATLSFDLMTTRRKNRGCHNHDHRP